MINFYTRNEAATILQVSPYTISKYVRDGILNNYGTSRILKLSHEEVHSFYENTNFKNHKVKRDDLMRLEKKIGILESEIEVLKMMVGVGSLAPARNDDQLLDLHKHLMAMLLHNSWETREIMSIGDIMINLKDQEVLRLVQMKGTRAWTCLFDLSERMLHYVDSMLLPKTSEEILKNRLEAGRNRLYGLLYVSISEHIAMDKFWAKKIISSRVVEKNTDEFLMAFFAKRAQE